MRYTICLVSALAASLTAAQETVLGVYIFSRHGDRTAKSTPPANLTALGYEQVFTSGTYYRNRYVSSDATQRIYGINSDVVKESQLIASAPADTVLQISALGFLQGLYPPTQLSSQTLRNGTTVQAPLNGYQLIPLQTVETGANSENAAWLQGSTNCANAQLSSNAYYSSAQYLATLNRTQDLYNSVYPDVSRTFSQSETSFKNGYTIWCVSLLSRSQRPPQLDSIPTCHTSSILAFELTSIGIYYTLQAFTTTQRPFHPTRP